jgi:hypothetical protein
LNGIDNVSGIPSREIRALFDDTAVTVYQAYSPAIAEAALAAGRFVSPFKLGRMTWIKPSFLWMMYRCGWATKSGQERVLAITISREGFEWALAHSCLSHYDPTVHRDDRHWAALKQANPVRVQWDPDRSLTLDPLPYRAIQVGLAGEAVGRYVEEWILNVADVTTLAHDTHSYVTSGDHAAARSWLPVERPYALPDNLKAIIGAD